MTERRIMFVFPGQGSQYRGMGSDLCQEFGIARETYAEYVKLASIKETPGQPKAEAMVKLLVEGNEAVVRTARSVFPLVDKAGDEPTADLLTQRMQVHEKNAWMLRSMLENA